MPAAAAPVMASTQAMRWRAESTIITAKPAITAPATSGTRDGVGSQITATETSTSSPSTCSGITPVSTWSPRSPAGGSVLIQWARWSCQA